MTELPHITTQDFKLLSNQNLWNNFHKQYHYRKNLLKYKAPLINLESVMKTDIKKITVKHYETLIAELPNLEDKQKLDVALAGLKIKLPSKVLHKMMSR